MSHNASLLVTLSPHSINLRIYLERMLTEITDHIADAVLQAGGNTDSLAAVASIWPRLYITLLKERQRMSEVRGIAESSFVRHSNLMENDWVRIQANIHVVPIHALLFDALHRLGINIKPFSTLCAYKRDPNSEVNPYEMMPLSELESTVSEYIDVFGVGEADGHRLKELVDVLKKIRESTDYVFQSLECDKRECW
ncbi:hypothetical protein BDD12DRAFT_983433 [Trichophaea hybrida]|nr:hypothetical protein BDD12DRAFT_983433 [Trichophaea hybrida]